MPYYCEINMKGRKIRCFNQELDGIDQTNSNTKSRAMRLIEDSIQ